MGNCCWSNKRHEDMQSTYNLIVNQNDTHNENIDNEKMQNEIKYEQPPLFDELTWDHVVKSIECQLYPKISQSLNRILQNDAEFKLIKTHDLSNKTIKKIIKRLSEVNNLSDEEITFIHHLMKRAQIFNPQTQRSIFDTMNNIDDDDEQQLLGGIIYHLSTMEYSSGAIKLYSSFQSDSTDYRVDAIVDNNTASQYRSANTLVDEKDSKWIMIDLLNVKVFPTHYQLTQKTPFFRNWQLKASNNSTDGFDGDWIILSDHRNDDTLTLDNTTHTWPIPNHYIDDDVMYSQFKVEQFEKNSEETYTFLLSAFEIYGIATDNAKVKKTMKTMNYDKFYLNKNIIFDIYSVHKAFFYREYGYKNYHKNDLLLKCWD
eukprot:20776_1